MTFTYKRIYPKLAPTDGNPPAGAGPTGFEPGDPAAAEAAALAAAEAEGKPANAPANAPAKTKVVFGDQEFEVDANLAAALAAFQTNVEAELRSQKQQPAPAAKPPKADEPYDFETGIFTEPAVAIQKLREQIIDQVRGEYAAVEDKKQFWTTFYNENKDLKELDFLVESVMNKNWAAIKDLPAASGMKELAKLSREAAVKLGRPAGKQQEDDGKNTNNRQVTEGASTPGVKIPVQPQNTQVTSLSEIVRQRQAAKRTGGKAA